MWCLAAAPVLAQTAGTFDHLFELGTAHGLNPRQKFDEGVGRRVFGPPDGASPVVGPASVTVDPDERIWIADPRAHGVHLFDITGGSAYRFLAGAPRLRFQCPTGIDSDLHGRIYVADACLGQVFVFDRDRSFLRLLLGKHGGGTLVRPVALTVSADLKSIYVADAARHKVIVLNQEGETIREWGRPGELAAPASISVYDDQVYVFDRGAGRVQVYSPGGTLERTLCWERVKHPSAFAIDPEDGLYYIGDPNLQMVQVFREDGELVGAFGQAGTGPGEMRTPQYLYVDAAHRIYVADPDNARVLVYRPATGAVLPAGLPGTTAKRPGHPKRGL